MPYPLLQSLTASYNRQRQAKITQELAELCAGAAASG
jgi:F0F1-type ATP synthase gamma subunit